MTLEAPGQTPCPPQLALLSSASSRDSDASRQVASGSGGISSAVVTFTQPDKHHSRVDEATRAGFTLSSTSFRDSDASRQVASGFGGASPEAVVTSTQPEPSDKQHHSRVGDLSSAVASPIFKHSQPGPVRVGLGGGLGGGHDSAHRASAPTLVILTSPHNEF